MLNGGHELALDVVADLLHALGARGVGGMQGWGGGRGTGGNNGTTILKSTHEPCKLLSLLQVAAEDLSVGVLTQVAVDGLGDLVHLLPLTLLGLLDLALVVIGVLKETELFT